MNERFILPVHGRYDLDQFFNIYHDNDFAKLKIFAQKC